jgi:hypothetical protein
MKKPANKFAGVLWIIAVVVLFAEPIDSVVDLIRQGEAADWIALFWKTVESTIPYSAMLAGLAVLIELVDQIRWQVTQYVNRKSN